MTAHLLELVGRDDDGWMSWHCDDCSRAIRVRLNPYAREVIYPGDASVPHGLRWGGLTIARGPVAAPSQGDKDFLSDAGITWD